MGVEKILRIETSGGWGESGVFIIDRTRYHKEITVGELSSIVVPICKKYNVNAPTFEIRPHRRCQWGTCYPDRNLIALNLPIRIGNIYHELAHLITCKKYGRNHGHDWYFKRILTEILTDNNI
jgi:hypothetical protein